MFMVELITCTILTQVLPYWDWTVYYEQECLLDNPYFEADQLTEEDCEVSDSPSVRSVTPLALPLSSHL